MFLLLKTLWWHPSFLRMKSSCRRLTPPYVNLSICYLLSSHFPGHSLRTRFQALSVSHICWLCCILMLLDTCCSLCLEEAFTGGCRVCFSTSCKSLLHVTFLKRFSLTAVASFPFPVLTSPFPSLVLTPLHILQIHGLLVCYPSQPFLVSHTRERILSVILVLLSVPQLVSST